MGKMFELDDDLDHDLDVDDQQGAENDQDDDIEQDDGGIDIEIVDDTPEGDRNREPVKDFKEPSQEELEQYNDRVKKRINEMTRARHDERRRADQLARQNEELVRLIQSQQQRGTQMQEYISMGQQAYIEQAKKTATLAIESAKAKLRQAHDAGDTNALVEAQSELSQAQYQLQEANNFRPSPLPEPQTQGYTAPKTDREPAPQRIDGRLEDWRDANPWFQRSGDEDMTSYALTVHAQLERDRGKEFAGTREYYNAVDNAMRKVFPDRFEDDKSTQSAPASKQRDTVVAPAQRSTKPRRVRLTKTQLEIADRLGVSHRDYAEQLIALEKRNG